MAATRVSLAEYLADAPRNAERRAAQEAEWDLEGKEDARQLLFEREVAWKYAALTSRSINAFWRVEALVRGHGQRSSPLSRLPQCLVEAIAALAEGRGCDAAAREAVARLREDGRPVRAPQGVRVFARIRPAYAGKEGDGVVDRFPGGGAVLHDARLSRSHRTLRVQHHYFVTDGVFDGRAAADDVGARVVDPLLRRFLDDGRDAALLLFGQTGTGKTHTLREALDRLVGAFQGDGGPVQVRFLELAGKNACRDLLAGGKGVKLLSDEHEVVHFRGAVVVEARDGAELRRALDAGLALRASEETERNAASSRSHAVVRVERDGGAALTLVDLAGSERKWETMGMRSRAQNRESADINLSLMALKDCFRAAHAKSKRVPYRGSSLTRVLRNCFFEQDTSNAVHVLATLSPHADDLIHSVYSLATAALMAPGLADGANSQRSSVATERLAADLDASRARRAAAAHPDANHPLKWSPETTNTWLLTAEGGKFGHVVLPAGTTARDLLALSSTGIGDLFQGQGRAARDSHEGAMWVVGADTKAALARDMTNALKREVCKWRLE